jgi:hypothetical protein
LKNGAKLKYISTLKAPTLKITLEDTSYAEFDVDVGTLDVGADKESKLFITGKATFATVKIAGHSFYGGSLLNTTKTIINIDTSYAEVDVSDSLMINRSKSNYILNVSGTPKYKHENDIGPSPHLYKIISEGHNMPNFPFPPPETSDDIEIPRSVFNNCHSLRDVDRILSKALIKCNYNNRRYFSIPNGFVLMTQLEQIHSDASGTTARFRYDTSNVAKFEYGWNPIEHLKLMFRADPSFYRCFAFMVTDSPTSFDGKKFTLSGVSAFRCHGINVLPNRIGNIRFSDSHSCYVLIYEYEKKQHTKIASLKEKNSALTHLIRSGIWRALGLQQ